VSVDPDEVIIPHVWRDRDYLNELEGKVAAWQGWSVNLKKIDPHLRTLYIDLGENVLPVSKRIETFGEEFSNQIENLPEFVVMFVVDCPAREKDLLKKEGFLPRRINDAVVHACVVVPSSELFSRPILEWAAKGAKLVNMQKELSSGGRR